jgi:hypothetical protein
LFLFFKKEMLPFFAGKEMNIRIEKAQCVGNARCHAVAGELYPLDDDG